jgi:uncharacterized damage-inducible protein DinB
MDAAALLLDLFGRIGPVAREAVEGLSPDRLTERPGPDANTIAWLVWHLTRVQDGHIAELIDGAEQVYVTGDWGPRFGLASDPDDSGYGHSAAAVASVRPTDGDALLDYLDAVTAVTEGYLRGVSAEDLDAVVDRNWDPPVTLGVRLVSVADDCLEHAGQANYVRGLVGG